MKFFIALILSFICISVANGHLCAPGKVDEKVRNYLTAPNFNERFTAHLDFQCGKNPALANGTTSCKDLIKPAVSIMSGISQAVSTCDSLSPVKPYGAKVSADYSCGSYCTAATLEECTVSCSAAIASCYANPFDVQGCVDLLWQCVEAAPKCCTCGCLYEVWDCASCGY